MSSTATPTADEASLFTGLPSGIAAYVAIITALISAAIHLWLAPIVMAFDTIQAYLFVLAGIGFIGGIVVFLTRYWRREFYLVAVLYGLALLIAFVVMSGPINPLSIASKLAEVVFVVATAHLYRAQQPTA